MNVHHFIVRTLTLRVILVLLHRTMRNFICGIYAHLSQFFCFKLAENLSTLKM